MIVELSGTVAPLTLITADARENVVVSAETASDVTPSGTEMRLDPAVEAISEPVTPYPPTKAIEPSVAIELVATVNIAVVLAAP